MAPLPQIAAAVFWLVAAAAPALASDRLLNLEGRFVQGGLAFGITEAGARVLIDGVAVRVSKGGLFVVGFGRDAPPRVGVRVIYADGHGASRTLTVAPREYPVQRIDGLPSQQVTPGPEALKRIRLESAMIAAARTEDTERPYFASGFTWPVKGRISGVFGGRRILDGQPRRPHVGVDVAAPANTPVVAAGNGVVALAHEGMFFTGKTVIIDHGHGLNSVYAHMSAILVGQGQRVAKGEPLGRVGATGRATAPHLHWGVSLFATHLDPALIAGPLPEGD
ncbi:MAG: M23 family metallopeptidase [Rhodospirillales bacterium]